MSSAPTMTPVVGVWSRWSKATATVLVFRGL
jgi:hypothetical protein